MHHHHHTHSLSWKHLKSHPICLASVIYNILVVAVEIIILAFVTHMDFHDMLGYEGIMQLIHLVGIILLTVLNYWWIHTWSIHEDTKSQATAKFFWVSVIIFILHIILLHIIPRVIGFELHHHDEAANSETVEYVALGAIILFVTLAFRYKEAILQALNIKNKYIFRLQAEKNKE